MKHRRDRSERLAAAGFLSGCALVLFHRALFLGETFVDRDLRTFHRPTKALLAPLFHASHGFPLWNPFLASGQPFAANPQHEVFFPLTWLFFVLPFEWAFRLEIVLPVLASAAGTFFLLRTLGRSRLAALFAATTWGFGGYVLSSTNIVPFLVTVAPLPSALAFTVRVARSGRGRDVAGLATSLGLMALAGEPATLLAAPVLVLAAFLQETLGAVKSSPAAISRRLRRVAAGCVLGVAIGGATLIPGLHHARKTERAAGIGRAAAGIWSFPPIRIAEVVAPHALGHTERADERWFWGAPLYPEPRFPLLFSIYFGLLAAVLGVLAWSARRALPWCGAAILGLLLGAGTHLPIWGALRPVVPFLSSLRSPEKFLLLTLFPWCVASAFGFDLLLFGRRTERKRALGALLAVAVAAAAGLGVVAMLARQGPTLWVRLGASPAIAPALPATLERDALVLFATALAYAAIVWFMGRGLSRRAAGSALVLVAGVDLLGQLRPVVRTLPIEQVTVPPRFVETYRRQAVEGPLFHFAAYQIGSVLPAWELAAPPIPAFWGVPTTLDADLDLTELAWSTEATRRLLEVARREPRLMGTLLARRGVGAVARPVSDASGRSRVGLALLKEPRPFATCVSGIRTFRGGPGWVKSVLALGPGSKDLALLDEGDAPLPEAVSPGTARILSRAPDRIALEVSAQGPEPALLALAQTWDEGWSARVDGRPARLLEVDLSLSGVLVPPGRHEVTLAYGDRWVLGGVVLTLAGGLLAAFLALRSPRSGVRESAPPG